LSRKIILFFEDPKKQVEQVTLSVGSRIEKCGFVFQKRAGPSKPGKCPLCHGQLILPPLFSITGKDRA
jgi:predicted Zn-ribbon and HTH transcriptional regulator